jgi:dynein heavy chain
VTPSLQNVDESYRGLMNSVEEDPRVTETAGALGIFETLQGCRANLEKINEGVSAYLEKKRLLFPR